MFFRYFNANTCIRSNDLDAIANALTDILEKEKGCRRIPQLPQLEIGSEQLRDFLRRERPRVWVIGFCNGMDGWTIVKTSPVELLCPRATGSTRPRLSELAMHLGCDIFHYRVARDLCGILLEADATGRISLSGWNDFEVDDEDDIYKFYDEHIESRDRLPQFSLLEVPDSMQAAMKINEILDIDRKEATYEQLQAEENPDWELLTSLDNELLAGEAERVDCALGAAIDSTESCSYWHLHDLLYYAYARKFPKSEPPLDPAHDNEINPITEKPYREGEYDLVSQMTEAQIQTLKLLIVEDRPQILDELGVQLLYFQPPDAYNPNPPYINLFLDSQKEDEPEEADNCFWDSEDVEF